MALVAGIAGLGRVGRGVLRANFSQAANGRFDIRVACDVMPIDQIAYLLAHDSTYGKPPFSVDCDEDSLILGGKRVRYEQVDRRRGVGEEQPVSRLRDYGLDVFIDATGTASADHLRSLIRQGVARKTLCTWNVEGHDISLVYGVNHADYDPDRHHVLTSSTCTGNALVPVFFPLEKHIGIEYARIVTIHPVLSDQRALDGYHSSPQLGRSFTDSIVPTSTNVGKSAALVLPSLNGKLDCVSYRVPTAIVSAMDITLELSRQTSREQCLRILEDYAATSLSGIIRCDYGAWGHPRASIDFLGDECSSHILMSHLTVHGGRRLGLSLMHDNEWAYCCRVLDILGVIEQAGTGRSLERRPKRGLRARNRGRRAIVPACALA
ncbi:glyceraldehyde 3-phosphate dehydrogenase NAD-binding domain-containing protein [Methyloterricola oryzae]|uniref:glyceraldehyde 3-phosphate dehydrogenase NAD-binding domain-containing protein n=1 Tax=Methyloterricola oryzae TaxID=1495050 RepID=UPI0009E3ACA6|nr:glyceraldehyde 3-phosphate dehydrogenase NAD-binding domain-containing protein [Methyloterricola oryzae]